MAKAPHWKVLAPVRLQTLVLRHEPPGFQGETLNEHTLAWVKSINESGEAYLTPTLIGTCWAVRVSIGAAATEREHVAALWRLMREKTGG